MGNAVVKQALKDATEEVSRGIPLSKPLADSGVFPPMVYHMIEIGEETGNMEDMLDKVAAYYDEEVESATEALLAAMEPLIIIVMAVIVVPIVLAIMMPMYSLYDSIGAWPQAEEGLLHVCHETCDDRYIKIYSKKENKGYEEDYGTASEHEGKEWKEG